MKEQKDIKRKDVYYPTLEEFALTRRQFFRNLAIGSLVLGVGAGFSASSAFAGSGDEEMPYDGGMMAPEYYTVNLPVTEKPVTEKKKLNQITLADKKTVTYKVSFITYDNQFALACREHSEILHKEFAKFLEAKTCEDFNKQPSQQQIQDKIKTIIEAFIAEKTKLTPGIQAFALTVEGCS